MWKGSNTSQKNPYWPGSHGWCGCLCCPASEDGLLAHHTTPSVFQWLLLLCPILCGSFLNHFVHSHSILFREALIRRGYVPRNLFFPPSFRENYLPSQTLDHQSFFGCQCDDSLSPHVRTLPFHGCPSLLHLHFSSYHNHTLSGHGYSVRHTSRNKKNDPNCHDLCSFLEKNVLCTFHLFLSRRNHLGANPCDQTSPIYHFYRVSQVDQVSPACQSSLVYHFCQVYPAYLYDQICLVSQIYQACQFSQACQTSRVCYRAGRLSRASPAGRLCWGVRSSPVSRIGNLSGLSDPNDRHGHRGAVQPREDWLVVHLPHQRCHCQFGDACPFHQPHCLGP